MGILDVQERSGKGFELGSRVCGKIDNLGAVSYLCIASNKKRDKLLLAG